MKRILIIALLLIIICGVSFISTWNDRYGTVGVASWYGGYFKGKETASGEIFDPKKLTAAHRTIELGTYVKVTNLENQNTVTVKINDRGPFVSGRIIDLSKEAARKLEMVEKGLAKVKITKI